MTIDVKALLSAVANANTNANANDVGGLVDAIVVNRANDVRVGASGQLELAAIVYSVASSKRTLLVRSLLHFST